MEQAKQRGNEEELEAKHILAWEEDLQVHLLWFPCLFPFIALFFIHSSGSWTLLDCLVVKLCYYYDFLPIFFWFSSDDKFGCGFSCATDHRSHWFLHEMGFHLMGLLFVLLTVLCLRTFCSFVLGSLYPLSVPPLLRMVLDCVCYNFGWCRSISCHACNYATSSSSEHYGSIPLSYISFYLMNFPRVAILQPKRFMGLLKIIEKRVKL